MEGNVGAVAGEGRARGVDVNSAEYRSRQREFQPRGMDLPQAKLLDIEIGAIRSAAKQRENLRKHIRENLSNEALARQYGVHVRTIEKILSYESWSHL